MGRKILIAFISIIGFIFLLIINDLMKERNKDQTKRNTKDSNYYLTSPWVTSRVDWFFIPLPEKWKANNKDIEKKKADYMKISNEAQMFELTLKNFFLLCTYMDAKEGVYEGWDLDKSANAVTNQVLYNLKCKDISINKLPPFDNPTEVNYEAISTCEPYNYKAKLRGIRYESHILIVCICFKENDPALKKISERILSGIENKYPEVTNANK